MMACGRVLLLRSSGPSSLVVVVVMGTTRCVIPKWRAARGVERSQHEGTWCWGRPTATLADAAYLLLVVAAATTRTPRCDFVEVLPQILEVSKIHELHHDSELHLVWVEEGVVRLEHVRAPVVAMEHLQLPVHDVVLLLDLLREPLERDSAVIHDEAEVDNLHGEVLSGHEVGGAVHGAARSFPNRLLERQVVEGDRHPGPIDDASEGVATGGELS